MILSLSCELATLPWVVVAQNMAAFLAESRSKSFCQPYSHPLHHPAEVKKVHMLGHGYFIVPCNSYAKQVLLSPQDHEFAFELKQVWEIPLPFTRVPGVIRFVHKRSRRKIGASRTGYIPLRFSHALLFFTSEN